MASYVKNLMFLVKCSSNANVDDFEGTRQKLQKTCSISIPMYHPQIRLVMRSVASACFCLCVCLCFPKCMNVFLHWMFYFLHRILTHTQMWHCTHVLEDVDVRSAHNRQRSASLGLARRPLLKLIPSPTIAFALTFFRLLNGTAGTVAVDLAW